jgi:hypothetical protein
MAKRKKPAQVPDDDAQARGEASSIIKRLIDDEALRKAAAIVLDAAAATVTAEEVADKPGKKRRKGGLRKLLVLAGVAAVGVLGVSEGARGKLLDALFGGEEDFEYTSQQGPQPPADEAPGSPLSAV